MDIKCIALDLDRTTLNAQGRLSDGNRAALEYAISRGIHIVIASGRPLGSLPEDVLSVGGIEYAITSNGAAVYHLPTQKRLAHYTLTPSSVETILRLTATLPYALETFIDGHAYAGRDFLASPSSFGAPETSVGYFQRTRTPVENMRTFMQEHSIQLESIDLILGKDADLTVLRCLFQQELSDCYITSSVSHLLEISDKRCGKHTGVLTIAQTLGLAPSQIAAFGDGDNDVDMLQYVGCGIAVANASPACLAAADKITGHYDKDGVAAAIYELIN